MLVLFLCILLRHLASILALPVTVICILPVLLVILLPYVPFWGAPWCVERFGGKYLIYKKHVPRWIPRLSFWKSNSKNLNASNTSSNGYFANIIEKLKG